MLALNASPLNEHWSHVHCGVSLSSVVCILSLVVIDCIRVRSCCGSTPPPCESEHGFTAMMSSPALTQTLKFMPETNMTEVVKLFCLYCFTTFLKHSVTLLRFSRFHVFFVIWKLFGVLKESQFQHNVVFFWPLLEKNKKRKHKSSTSSFNLNTRVDMKQMLCSLLITSNQF